MDANFKSPFPYPDPKPHHLQAEVDQLRVENDRLLGIVRDFMTVASDEGHIVSRRMQYIAARARNALGSH